MDRIKVSAGIGENLFGFVIPKNAVFGKIGGVYYICDNFTPINAAGTFNIRVYNRDKSRFVYVDSDKFPAIHDMITKHVKKTHTNDLQVYQCEFKTRKKRRDFYAKKRQERAEKLRDIDAEMEYYSIAHDATKMRHVNYNFMSRAWSQACVDGKTLKEYSSTAPCAYAEKGADMNVMHNPKMFQKDSIKHPFKEYRPEGGDNVKNYTGRAELKEDDNGNRYVKVHNGGYLNPDPKVKKWCDNTMKRLNK